MRLFLSMWLLTASCFFLAHNPAIAGDDEALVIFEDNFSEDPLLNDWIVLSAGSLGGWVPPESPYCELNGWVDPALFTQVSVLQFVFIKWDFAGSVHGRSAAGI